MLSTELSKTNGILKGTSEYTAWAMRMAKEFKYLTILGHVAERMLLDKYQNKLMKERVTSHFGVKWAYYIILE